MTSPLSVSFKNRLKAVLTADNQQQILQYIVKTILDEKAKNVAIKDMHVTYRGSTSYWNWSLFKGVDDGIFSLIYKDNSWSLNYQINMLKLFIGTAILSSLMAVFMLINEGPWWTGIFAFSWLCGGNWIINVIRPGALAATISTGIDEMICGKKNYRNRIK